MASLWLWLRSLVFTVQMFLSMAILGLVFAPWAILDRQGAFVGIRTFCRWVRFTARWLIGLSSEVRGDVPEGAVLIASKHQSFFDIILLCSVLPAPKFIMKKELTRAPVLGWFARRIGCVPVDRGKRGAAISRMLEDVAQGAAEAGQLVIYPQGTRVVPGTSMPYKIGTGALYQQLNQTCIPAATNVGLFWPRSGVAKRPGHGIIEFLPAIEPGLSVEEFMSNLEKTVESATGRLMEESDL